MTRLIIIEMFLIYYLFYNGYSEKIVCSSNQTKDMPTEKVIFFESLNYPYIPDPDDDDQDVPICFLTFKLLNGENMKNKRGFIVSTDDQGNYDFGGYVYGFEVFDNTTSMTFTNLDNICDGHKNFRLYSFQGFALFDDWNDDDCPFESVSRVNPFNFTDESQIIYLQSSYFYDQIRKHSCLWQFSVPKGYGFKIIIFNLNIHNPTQFSIENSTQMIINERNAQLRFPYYNNDNYLRIFLSNHTNIVPPTVAPGERPESEFSGYISILKNDWHEANAKCNIVKNGDTTIWTNINENQNGYPKNARCDFNLIIPPFTNVLVDYKSLELELYVDLIKFYENNSNDSSYTIYDDRNPKLRLSGYTNGSDKVMLWQFTSDGSFQLRGFEIKFIEVSCKCSEPLINISCDFNFFFLISPFIHPYQEYCSNLKCNYTLKVNDECSQNLLAFHFKDANLLNVYKVYTNNTVLFVFNSNALKRNDYTLYLFSGNEYMFEIITGELSYSPQITISAGITEAPEMLPRVILTKDNPYFTIDLNLLSNKAFTIEISDEKELLNATIELYINMNTQAIDISFYADGNLTKFLEIENCFVRDYAFTSYICKTLLRTLTIYPKPSQSLGFLFAKLSTAYSEGCYFHENVYTLATDITISAIAKNHSNCNIFFLVHFDVPIKHFWTTAQKENVKLYSGVYDKKIFFEFISQTLLQWQDIFLRSKIYFIEIPKGSSVLFSIENDANLLYNISTFPYQTNASTPDYGVDTNHCAFSDYSIDFSVQNYYVKITVLDYNISSEEKCITHVNQIIILPPNNNQYELQYQRTDDTTNCSENSGILFHIESMPPTKKI